MNIETIKHNIRKRGLWGSCLFYASQFHTALCIQMMRAVVFFRRTADNRIVLKNNRNTDFSDNTKALYDFFLTHKVNERFTIVWCVSEPKKYKKEIKPGVKFVTTEGKNGWISLRAVYYGATSRFFFFTHDTCGINRFRCRDQIAVNLEHGNGYKMPKKDLDKRWKNYIFDFIEVSGPLFVDVFIRYWHCRRDQVLILGFPRYDWFKAGYNKKEIMQKLTGIADCTEKIILWLPTFINNQQSGFPEAKINANFGFMGIENMEDLIRLDRACEENHLRIIIKKHPDQKEWPEIGNQLKNVFLLKDNVLKKNHITVIALMSISDAMLTDYSSATVDYLLLNRPMGFVLTDYARYAETRGFNFVNPLAYMPGMKLYSLNDILLFLENISKNKDSYAEERRMMKKEMHTETDCYCKRFSDHFHITQ